jgi:adenylate cyclase
MSGPTTPLIQSPRCFAASLAELGQRLRSWYLVDGSVRRDGEQLRLVVELVDSQDGRVVLSLSNTVDSITLGSTEQTVVGRIAGTLHSKMSRTEQRRALASPPKTLDVYALTARGMAKMTQYSAIGLRESRELYGQALKIDPNYAPAWAFLGIANTIDVGLHLTGEWDEKRVGEVLAQIRRAIALQPDLPLAHHALAQALALALGSDFEGALSAAKRSCELSPNDAGCYYSLGKA